MPHFTAGKVQQRGTAVQSTLWKFSSPFTFQVELHTEALGAFLRECTLQARMNNEGWKREC